jgi:vancomycin permeability regulator SanA
MFAIVVLGCQIKRNAEGYFPSKTLEYRLQKALEISKSMTKEYVIIVSGKGNHQDYSEALVMKNWLIAHGISKNRVLLEDKSMSTIENAIYTKEVLSCFNKDTSHNVLRQEINKFRQEKSINLFDNQHHNSAGNDSISSKIENLIVITNDFHMPRVIKIFNFIIPKFNIEFICCSTPIEDRKWREKNEIKSMTGVDAHLKRYLSNLQRI